MKKTACLIIFCFLINSAYPAIYDSSNSFEIEINEVPPGTPITNSHKGLSDGAITAITLGSVFGGIGILSGIGYYFFKCAKELACGFACGIKSPYQIVGLDNPEIITKSSKTYLIKAYEHTKKSNLNQQKFLLVPDTIINPNTYNTVFFEIPEEFKNSEFEIVQASEPFILSKGMQELDVDIFLNPKDENPLKIPTSSIEINPDDGILIKKGKIENPENKTLALTTIYKHSAKLKKPKSYAVIVRFSAVNK